MYDEDISESIGFLARSITAAAAPGTDETGGTITSLTEAVMGITAGLCRIADAIEHLAYAVGSETDG